MTRMATQNSSKSRFPSLSTSAKSHTRSSWSSRRPLFFSTGAACSPVRYFPPLVLVEKMFQYVSISWASMRGAILSIRALLGCAGYDKAPIRVKPQQQSTTRKLCAEDNECCKLMVDFDPSKSQGWPEYLDGKAGRSSRGVDVTYSKWSVQ